MSHTYCAGWVGRSTIISPLIHPHGIHPRGIHPHDTGSRLGLRTAMSSQGMPSSVYPVKRIPPPTACLLLSGSQTRRRSSLLWAALRLWSRRKWACHLRQVFLPTHLRACNKGLLPAKPILTFHGPIPQPFATPPAIHLHAFPYVSQPVRVCVNRLKKGPNRLFDVPCGLGLILKKVIFCPCWTQWTDLGSSWPPIVGTVTVSRHPDQSEGWCLQRVSTHTQRCCLQQQL